jgi:hypothetical protein
VTDVVAYLAKSGHVIAAATRRSSTNRPTPGQLVGMRLATRLLLDRGKREGISLALDVAEMQTAIGDVPDKDLTRLVTIGVDGSGDEARVVPLENAAGISTTFTPAGNQLVVTVASRPSKTVFLLLESGGSYSTLEAHALDPTGKLTVTGARYGTAIVCVPGMVLKQV